VQIHGGGFVSGVLFHPGERDLVYTRTDVGGAFRWNGDAGRWIPLNDDLGMNDSQLTGVVSFAVDPNDVNRLYLACGQYPPSWARDGAILRSRDRGATWNRTELSIKLGGTGGQPDDHISARPTMIGALRPMQTKFAPRLPLCSRFRWS
jgi:hypothetical protein